MAGDEVRVYIPKAGYCCFKGNPKSTKGWRIIDHKGEETPIPNARLVKPEVVDSFKESRKKGEVDEDYKKRFFGPDGDIFNFPERGAQIIYIEPGDERNMVYSTSIGKIKTLAEFAEDKAASFVAEAPDKKDEAAMSLEALAKNSGKTTSNKPPNSE